MVTVRGRAETKAFLRQLPERIESRLLKGAGRAAIDVIGDEAGERVRSDVVREGLKKEVRVRDGRIVARLYVENGWARSLGTWLEYGTVGHFISVDRDQSGGRTARRVNDLAKEGTLVIAGSPVGATVWHPGATAHPFLRVSLDVKADEAVQAAQRYINANVSRLGNAAGDEAEA
ncbi:HK97 gp10 family phage protein [Sphingomonas adhaesiva]|uniref:HK97 gp10 family phage protein n=1 Tax=Sphingomonas adhaesiva TaxID=28212 RepID=UPI002FF45A8C